jgi:hypothetical protein
LEHGFSYYSVGRPAVLTEEVPAFSKRRERA